MTARRPRGRPALPPEEARRTYSLRLPPALVERVDAAAEALGERRTDVIERAIARELARLEGEVGQ